MIHHLMNIPYAVLLTVAQRAQLQGQHKKAELPKKLQQRGFNETGLCNAKERATKERRLRCPTEMSMSH